MACPLGNHIPVDCPICHDPVPIPVKQVDRDELVLTVQIDVGVLREHIAATHNRVVVTV